MVISGECFLSDDEQSRNADRQGEMQTAACINLPARMESTLH